jgi:hypothetical protein
MDASLDGDYKEIEMRLILTITTHFLAIAWTSTVAAQCINTASPSCGVYEQCFADRCDCTGSPDEYFISYGKKYCERFLDLPGLSQKGRQWRDSTLRCLQEKIVPELPADGDSKKCNCKEMRSIAFDSHVACYTKPGNSICDLPNEDLKVIFDAVDPLANSMDKKGISQALRVFGICLGKWTGEQRKRAQEIIEKHGP